MTRGDYGAALAAWRAAFVWAVWLGMTAAAGVLVARYGGRIPVQDDYYYQAFRTDPAVPSVADLWCQLNEHRYPLPRLATWAAARALGPGLRVHMAVNLAAVAAACAGLIAAARRVRGRAHPADAFLPLVALGVSDSPSRVWAVEINFYLTVALTLAALSRVATMPPAPPAGRMIGVGVVAVLLTLCGVPGVLLGGSLGVWLACAGWWAGRGGRPRAAAAAGVFAAAVFGLIAATFVGLTLPPGAAPASPGWGTAARYFLRVLGGGWGSVVEEIGPAEPTGWPPVLGVATVVVLAATAGLLVRAVRRPADRAAATGLLAVLAGVVTVAAAASYGRAEISRGVLLPKFVSLMIPLPCGVYLAWVRCGGRAAAWACPGLFLAAAVVAWPNAAAGFTAARNWHAPHLRILEDVYAGLPASALAEKYGWYLYPIDPGYLPARFEELKAKGVSPFHAMAAEPRRRDVPVRWQVEGYPAAGPDGFHRADDRLRHVFLTVTLTGCDRVTGVRVRYTVDGPPGSVSSEAVWDRPLPGGLTRSESHYNPLPPGDGRERSLWLGEGVTRFTIAIRGPARVRIECVSGFVAE